jgi:hypothetical protein
MGIDSQDRKLTMAMRKVLAYAKQEMPESIICIFSFTQAEDDSVINLNKIACNAQDRMHLQEQVFTVMTNFVAAQVVDLTDTEGTMQ